MTRAYRQVRRAEGAARTKGRIVEAAEALWREAGPRGTAVAEVARRAGVDRLTVYNHFDDADLARAVWDGVLARHPMPDLAARAEEDPEERLRGALGALWDWYGAVAGVLGPVLRDAPAMAALAPVAEGIAAALAAGAGAMAPGRRQAPGLGPTLRVALAVPTWEALAPLGREVALDLVEGWVRAAEEGAGG